jgi:hypothetical protein
VLVRVDDSPSRNSADRFDRKRAIFLVQVGQCEDLPGVMPIFLSGNA